MPVPSVLETNVLQPLSALARVLISVVIVSNAAS